MVTTCCSPAFASERTLVDSTSDGKQRVREIQELRQENSDTYLLSDGTCECVVYSEDKYFKNENGNYVVINNAVKPEKYKSVSNDYGFANAANSFKVRFSDKKASVLITTESECLAFSLINSEPKNVKVGAEGNSYRFQEFNLRSNNCITYVDAYKDTDIIYSVQNDYVKEYIVLKSPAAQSEFLFEVDTSNYDIIKENNGNLRVCNKNGTPVFDFGSLFAVDSAGNYTDKLEYTVLKSTDNNTMIKVSFTSDYLEEADRVFPVLIDPSVMVTGANKTKDSFVSSRYPSTNYYMQNWLKTGHDEDFGIRRSYVRFNLPSFIIESSVLTAYVNIKYYGGNAPGLEAYRVMGSWTSSSLTWNNRPRYNTVNSSTGMTALSNDWYRLYVTDIVRGWYAGDYNNSGFVIKDKTESTTSHWTTFYSSDAASPNKPELHIIYSERKYLSFGSANKTIYIYPYNFSSTWQTAINQSRYKWNNSSAPVNFYTSSNSNNRIYVSQYDYKAYGITYALELSGNELTKFKIELNSRTIMSAASAGSLENFIQSVLVHELGHTIWLADNPVTEKDSIMKYTRDRNTMVSPTAYDISNVAAKYNKNGGK